MLNEAQNAFPVIIPALHPIRNVLEGFRKVHNFSKIWQYLNTSTIHIIQIGAGGTGGYTAVDLMRFIGNLPKDIQKCIYYTIIDGDVFEEKNLGRQLCQEDDIGINKAEALVNNYASTLGCISEHIVALPEYITSVQQLTKLSFGVPNIKFDNLDSYGKKIWNFGNTRFTECFKTSDCSYDKSGYPTFYDGKEHSTLDIRYKSLYTEFDISNYDDDDVFPGWCSLFEQSDKNECIVPIFIDCVDNNTVRNIINATIESIGSCVKDVRELLINALINYEDECFNYHNCYDIDIFNNSLKNNTLKDWKLYLDIMNNFIVTDQTNTVIPSILTKTFRNNRLRVFNENDIKIPAVYLVASGNGKYAGQVSWGRYSIAPVDNYCNTTSILRYEDLWGSEEKPGLYMSKDKNINNYLENLKVPKSVISSKDDYGFTYPNFVDCTSGPDGEIYYKFPEFSVVYINDECSYLLPQNWKFVGTCIGNFTPNDPNMFTDDLVLKLFIGEYNIRKIQDTDYGVKAFCKMISLGAHLQALDSEVYMKNDEVISKLNNAGVDSSYFNAINANHYTCAKHPFKSTDPSNLLPFFDRYSNFTDWVSQYLSVPLPYQIYPNLLDVREDEREERMSCAERAEQNIQFINANKTAANLVVQYVTNIINGLFALETPGGEEYRMVNVATEFDTYTDTMINKKLTSSFLQSNHIKCSEASIEIAKGEDARKVWHKYNDVQTPVINEIK